MVSLFSNDEDPIGDRLWWSHQIRMTSPAWWLQHNDHLLMIMCSVLISYCVCRRPNWKPKTQPQGSSAVVWLCFWFSNWFIRKTLDYSHGSCLYVIFHIPFLSYQAPRLTSLRLAKHGGGRLTGVININFSQVYNWHFYVLNDRWLTKHLLLVTVLTYI